MPGPFDDYQVGSANWRKTLRQNKFRTSLVILLFFLVYGCIGVLVDMFLKSEQYPDASIPDLFHALITLQFFPMATCIMLGVAAVSLLVSYALHDRLMLLGTDYHEITPETANSLQEKQLYNVVEEMKVAAGLKYMPRLYIIDADYMNAFASGYSEKSAMMAITRGLLQKLDRDELQAVMAHELSHIRHLDIRLTLTASLLANLSLMVLDLFFYNALFASNDRDGNNRSRNNLAMIIMILRYLLPVFSVLLLLYLSRTRELMADAGAVELTRQNQPLASALMKISEDYSANHDAYQAQQPAHEQVRREAYIFDPTQAGLTTSASLADFFSTHPSLEARLRALGINKRV